MSTNFFEATFEIQLWNIDECLIQISTRIQLSWKIFEATFLNFKNLKGAKAHDTGTFVESKFAVAEIVQRQTLL